MQGGIPENGIPYPQSTQRLLDLGCGTGLELDEIFKLFPDVSVTGIDLTDEMLQKLREKHPNQKMELICGDYFEVELGEKIYDCCISFETMHHFSHQQKTALYQRIKKALKDGGCYIECDYMVEEQEEEDRLFAENERLRKEQGIPDEVICHFDTPCTIDNQIKMLTVAGFEHTEQVFRIGCTTILVAR